MISEGSFAVIGKQYVNFPHEQKVEHRASDNRGCMKTKNTSQARQDYASNPERYLSESDAAKFLGFSRSQVAKLRTSGLIPASVISVRCIRYKLTDLVEFMEMRRRGGDGDPTCAAKGRVDSKMVNPRRRRVVRV